MPALLTRMSIGPMSRSIAATAAMLAALDFGDIERRREGPDAFGLEFRFRSLQPDALAPVQHDLSARQAEAARERPPDALRRAGHQRKPAGEVEQFKTEACVMRRAMEMRRRVGDGA